MTDNDLIDKLRVKDKKAARYFYRTYVPKLSRYVESKVSNFQDAEEITQDALFAFLESIRDFEGKSSVKTFLFAIASHKIIDYYRRKKIKQVLFSQMPQLEGLVSHLLNPEEELDMSLVKQKIHGVLGRLLPHYRQALMYKYMDNMSVALIAEKLSISLKGAESILFRARKAFVEAFVSI